MFRWKKKPPEPVAPAVNTAHLCDERAASPPPSAPMSEEEFEALVAGMDREQPECEPCPPSIHSLNYEFRRAVLTGEDVRGEVLLSRDVLKLSDEQRQEVLDQIAIQFPDHGEVADGTDSFLSSVFAYRARWGWAIDRYLDDTMEEMVSPAEAFGKDT